MADTLCMNNSNLGPFPPKVLPEPAAPRPPPPGRNARPSRRGQALCDGWPRTLGPDPSDQPHRT
jgi:hypothetical protein